MTKVVEDSMFCIKSGYTENLVQTTYDPSDETEYWSEARIATASLYQYDVYALAAKLVRQRGSGSVMDVGSGPPRKLATLVDDGKVDVHIVDQPNTAALARRILPRASFHAVNLEVADLRIGRQFDVIICADVIEHLVDPRACLEFIRAHLAPHGALVLSTPERDVLRGQACIRSMHPQHVREWNQAEFCEFISGSGFRVVNLGLMPQMRASMLRRLWGRTRQLLGRPPSWYSCQYLVCEARSE